MNAQEEINPDKTIQPHAANQPDEYVRCPYFPEHELRKNRLPYHLMKCQSNPRAPKLVACPYNFLHRVRPEDAKEHLLLCEDKIRTKFVDKELPSFGKTKQQCFGYNARQESGERVRLDCDEDEW